MDAASAPRRVPETVHRPAERFGAARARIYLGFAGPAALRPDGALGTPFSRASGK